MSNRPDLVPVGDCGLSIVFGQTIDPAIHRRIHALCQALDAARPTGVREWVPTYGALLLVYAPELTTFGALSQAVEGLLSELPAEGETQEGDMVEIPVCYGGDFGPDLEAVAAHTGLSAAEVIERHSAPTYLIHMLGFTPGFPYLGGMDEQLETPRLKKPRTKIPAGAVGIAGKQTGVYPSASPGGWQLIGQTPLKLFDPERKEPFLLKAGQQLKFKPIDTAQFKAMAAAVSEKETNAQAGAESPVLEVLQQGALTTVQDSGRTGYRAFGVTAGGVMDRVSAGIANALVGNLPKAAVLEMTLAGGSFKVLTPCLAACSGGEAAVSVNGKPVPQHRSFWLCAGDVLQIGALTGGLRTYLAVRGGFEGSKVMGSRSTDLKGGFGGHYGRKLAAGDLLSLGSDCEGMLTEAKPQRLVADTLPEGKETEPIRVIAGPQAHLFSEADLDRFVSQTYQVTPECDRMGMRLSGEPLSPIGGGDILSDGILPGAVQVPGHGQPIIMLADCQTTGGYAKIAQVVTADLSKLAQFRPGESIRFEWVDLEQARVLYLESLEPPQIRPCGKQWQLTVNGQVFQVEVEEIQ